MAIKKTISPPRLSSWILEHMILRSVRYGAIGDFSEQYCTILQEKGRFVACAWYRFQIIQILPAVIIDSIYWSIVMFKNYLKIAWRNIGKHKGYSFINISGLAISSDVLLDFWIPIYMVMTNESAFLDLSS